MFSNPFTTRKSVLPGFGITMGVTLLYLVIIVALPLAAMVLKTASLGWAEFWSIVTSDRALSTYRITLGAAALATLINAGFGLLLAWVLVRYEFPGKRLIDGLVDLPFALPTAIAGLALVTVFSRNGWFGQYIEPMGIKIAYAPLGIAIAMAFTSAPFVIRTVQPVLEDLSDDVEQAAETLGARPWQIFRHVIWPMIFPAFLAGSALSFARSLGEFGAIVFISGNLPFKTEVTSLLVFIRLDEFDYPSAAALAMVMLIVAFLMLLTTNLIQAWQLRYAERS
ncbi:sulfate ABC transporter permease subunit CysT [Phyllobacterium leguminum]|uniref:Sulfate transport system permease protein CysT n=1 Tax=Phyllobacterium leguminum TaxID=314237 RepID=A0A318TAL0_9HYPH|nr:sulfate ABC transporter permease subunit CysT [Phyllobacterium leguminum]PYE90086.1 sulfate transport system permease protein [Phyllobacterium leguminum]